MPIFGDARSNIYLLEVQIVSAVSVPRDRYDLTVQGHLDHGVLSDRYAWLTSSRS